MAAETGAEAIRLRREAHKQREEDQRAKYELKARDLLLRRQADQQKMAYEQEKQMLSAQSRQAQMQMDAQLGQAQLQVQQELKGRAMQAKQQELAAKAQQGQQQAAEQQMQEPILEPPQQIDGTRTDIDPMRNVGPQQLSVPQQGGGAPSPYGGPLAPYIEEQAVRQGIQRNRFGGVPITETTTTRTPNVLTAYQAGQLGIAQGRNDIAETDLTRRFITDRNKAMQTVVLDILKEYELGEGDKAALVSDLSRAIASGDSTQIGNLLGNLGSTASFNKTRAQTAAARASAMASGASAGASAAAARASNAKALTTLIAPLAVVAADPTKTLAERQAYLESASANLDTDGKALLQRLTEAGTAKFNTGNYSAVAKERATTNAKDATAAFKTATDLRDSIDSILASEPQRFGGLKARAIAAGININDQFGIPIPEVITDAQGKLKKGTTAEQIQWYQDWSTYVAAISRITGPKLREIFPAGRAYGIEAKLAPGAEMTPGTNPDRVISVAKEFGRAANYAIVGSTIWFRDPKHIYEPASAITKEEIDQYLFGKVRAQMDGGLSKEDAARAVERELRLLPNSLPDMLKGN